MDMRVSCTNMELISARRADWYLVQCRPPQDGRLSYECGRPLARRAWVLRAKRQQSYDSLLPGYLFTILANNTSWSSLRSTRGVSHVVSFGGRPLRVDNSLVLKMQYHSRLINDVGCNSRDIELAINSSYLEVDAIVRVEDAAERTMLLVIFLSQQDLRFSAAKIALMLWTISRCKGRVAENSRAHGTNGQPWAVAC